MKLTRTQLKEMVQEAVKKTFLHEALDDKLSGTFKTKKELKLKSGKNVPAGTAVEVIVVGTKIGVSVPEHDIKVRIPIAAAHVYITKFVKAPSLKTLEKWSMSGVAKTVTGHRTEPDGYGPDGSPSWLLVFGLI